MKFVWRECCHARGPQQEKFAYKILRGISRVKIRNIQMSLENQRYFKISHRFHRWPTRFQACCGPPVVMRPIVKNRAINEGGKAKKYFVTGGFMLFS